MDKRPTSQPELVETTEAVDDPGLSIPISVLPPCGLGRRLLVMIYDSVVIIAILMAAAAMGLLFGQSQKVALHDPVYTAYLVVFWFLYLAWCWRCGGITLGMRAWKVRLIADGSDQVSWKQCSIRFLMSLVSATALGVGFLWALFNPRKLTWHDSVSRTRLVRTGGSD